MRSSVARRDRIGLTQPRPRGRGQASKNPWTVSLLRHIGGSSNYREYRSVERRSRTSARQLSSGVTPQANPCTVRSDVFEFPQCPRRRAPTAPPALCRTPLSSPCPLSAMPTRFSAVIAARFKVSADAAWRHGRAHLTPEIRAALATKVLAREGDMHRIHFRLAATNYTDDLLGESAESGQETHFQFRA